jgi:predicted kinase
MKTKSPFVILLSGIPMSGKSTWVRENYPDTLTISRDELVMEVAGTRDYNLAFKTVNQKAVDKLLVKRITDAATQKVDVIIDMTNLSKKVRAKNLSYFSDDYYKVAVVLPILDAAEYKRRNDFRSLNENKFIPPFVITNMMNSFVVPTEDEGFDKIISV